jgi:hypothetical protein
VEEKWASPRLRWLKDAENNLCELRVAKTKNKEE